MTETEKQKRLAAKEEAAAKEVLTLSLISKICTINYVLLPKSTTPRAQIHYPGILIIRKG